MLGLVIAGLTGYGIVAGTLGGYHRITIRCGRIRIQTPSVSDARSTLETLSVNAAIERLHELDGQVICVVGALSLDFEGHCIDHIPKSEVAASDPGKSNISYPSSIWVTFDLEAIGCDYKWLKQFDKRHVRVVGMLRSPDPKFGGCGHFSLWPAEITVSAIEKK